jgi:hypothetical protein
MSNLKNASLVLKTTDLFDNTPSALVLGYYETTTKLVVSAINGYIPANVIIPNITTGTPNASINTDGYGYITVNTAGTTTTSHLTKAMTSIGNILSVTNYSARVSSNLNGYNLVLTSANSSVAVGQFVTGIGIPPNTQIVAGSGRNFTMNNSTTVQTVTVSFWDVPAINIYDAVLGLSYTEGTIIISNVQSSYTNGLFYITNVAQTISSENVSFYAQQQYTLYNTDLTNATYTESNGTCNQFRCSMTWNSINLRTLLGDMYNDYDLFNLCLNSIATAHPYDTISTDTDNLNVVVKIKGLPFINQTYDVSSQHNRDNTTLCSYRFNGATPSNAFYNNNNIATFGKNQEQCNITIYYERIIDGQLPSYTNVLPPQTACVDNPFPHTVFCFDIVGVEKYSKNGNRI